MKKGLIFVIFIALLYWGFYFSRDMTRKTADERVTEVKSSLEKTASAVRSANRAVIQTSIEIFKQHERRYPNSLRELKEKGYISKIPDPGEDGWRYDPETGAVE